MLRAIGEAKPGRRGEEDLARVLGGTMDRDNGGAVTLYSIVTFPIIFSTCVSKVTIGYYPTLGPGRARSMRDSPGSSSRKSALYGDLCMSAQCA